MRGLLRCFPGRDFALAFRPILADASSLHCFELELRRYEQINSQNSDRRSRRFPGTGTTRASEHAAGPPVPLCDDTGPGSAPVRERLHEVQIVEEVGLPVAVDVRARVLVRQRLHEVQVVEEVDLIVPVEVRQARRLERHV